MPTPLVVNQETYEYPVNRDPAGWGGEATGWAQAVTTVLGSLAGPNDILNTVANIANGQATPAVVPGLSFDTALVRGATVNYNVYRVTSAPSAQEVVEQGIMLLSYLPNANTWDMVILSSRQSGVTFSISNAGQVMYTSSTLTGVNYNGSITFRAVGLT
jgi:hypothetical protein